MLLRIFVVSLLSFALSNVVVVRSISQPADLTYELAPPPIGTVIISSFETEAGVGPDVLLDGNKKTFLKAKPNTADTPQSLFLRFAKPLDSLAGVHTGRSDKFHNYFPKEAEFYVDTTGDGEYDTFVGRTTELGPDRENIQDHLFDIKPGLAYGIEIRVTEMSQKGLRRAFTMNEVKLLYSEQSWAEEMASPDTGATSAGVGLGDVRYELRGPRVPLVLTTDDTTGFRLTMTNGGSGRVAFRPTARLTPYEGEPWDWVGDPVTLEPGQSRSVGFDLDGFGLGWCRVNFSAMAKDAGADQERPRVPIHSVMVAVIEPVGTRDWRHGEGFGFGISGALQNAPIAELAAAMGVDWERGSGPWNQIEPEPGRYDWSQLDREAELARVHGITIQALTGFAPEWAAKPGYLAKYEPTGWQRNGTVSPRPDAWARFLRDMAARYDGVVTMYEIWNEPDLEGFYLGTTEDYLELQRTAYQAIKSGSPRAMVGTGGFATVGGHGGHHLNPDLIPRTLMETNDAFDYIAHHEHGKFDHFQSMIDGRLAELMAAMPRPKPLYFTETATAAGQTDRGRRVQAADLVKKFSFAHARGAEGYLWFFMYREPHRHAADEGWGMLVGEDLEPQPILPAFSTMVKRLRDRPESGQITMPLDDQWVLRFDDKASRVLVAWTEDPDRGTQHVAIDAGGGDVRVFDLMGNGVAASQWDGVTLIDLGATPQYVHANTDPASVTVIGPLVHLPGERFVKTDSAFDVAATLRNPWSSPIVYALQWRSPSGEEFRQRIEVPANQSVEAMQSIPAMEPGDLPLLRLAYTLEGRGVGGELRQEIRQARVLPGRAADGREPDFVLREEIQVVNFNAFDPTRQHLTWQGPRDLSAEAWLTLEDHVLVLTFDITDDQHVQPHPPETIWAADSVQYALTLPNREGRWELGVTRDNRGRTLSHCWSRPSGTSDPVPAIRAESRILPNGIRYVVRIPLADLGLTRQTAVQGFNFSFIVNDRDGDDREGYIELSPGIGQQKDPSQYPAVRFSE